MGLVEIYRQYNIFFVCTHREDELYKFLKRLKSLHFNLKFTSKCSGQEINFLDITVKLNNNQFAVDPYCKPTDCHQYHHYNSCHPEHIKDLVFIVKDVVLKGYALSKHT